MPPIDLGQVFTRRCVADYMVDLFTLPSDSSVLDPCFGEGVFINSMTEKTHYVPHGYELDKQLYSQYQQQNSMADLHHADFLRAAKTPQYDGIIMNPPYVRHEKIDDLRGYGITKAALRKKKLFAKLPATANLYMYFIVKAIDLLKQGGELIVIFPESWQNARSETVFWKILETGCSVTSRIHMTGRAFEKNALVDVMILKLVKVAGAAACAPSYLEIDDETIRERSVAAVDGKPSFPVALTRYASVRRGLTTGDNATFINPKIEGAFDAAVLREIISSPKLVTGYSTKAARKDQILILPKDRLPEHGVVEYLKMRESKIALAGKPKTLAKRIAAQDARWYSLAPIDCTGILFGYIIRRDMRFILNEQPCIARDNFYVIAPRIDRHLLLALLNNYYIYCQLEQIGKHYGGGMLKLQKYDLEALVLPDVDALRPADRDKLIELGRALAATDNKQILDEITGLLARYETRSADTIKTQFALLQSGRLERSR